MEDWSRAYILHILSLSVEKIGERSQTCIWELWLQKSKYEQLVFPLATPQVKMAARAFLGNTPGTHTREPRDTLDSFMPRRAGH